MTAKEVDRSETDTRSGRASLLLGLKLVTPTSQGCNALHTYAAIPDHLLDKSGGSSACWPFVGGCDRDGYGRFRGKAAHRVALAAALGRPLDGHALHHCDNPPCCNPAHLYEGTQVDNMRDRARRGRAACGVRNGRNKLSPKAVAVIRRWEGRASTYRLGRLLGVHNTTIRDIWAGDIWKVTSQSADAVASGGGDDSPVCATESVVAHQHPATEPAREDMRLDETKEV